MKFNFEKLPVIPARDGRPVEDLDVNALKESGAVTSYGLSEGDEITFPEKGDVKPKRQKVYKDGDIYQYFVNVMRNGAESYLSLGALRRQGVNRTTTCEFCADMIDSKKYKSDADRMEVLYGRTIKVTGMKELTINKFENRVPTGETEVRSFPVIEFVNA